MTWPETVDWWSKEYQMADARAAAERALADRLAAALRFLRGNCGDMADGTVTADAALAAHADARKEG